MSGGRGIERDLRRILVVQALRAFAYGFGTVILPTALLASGLSDGEAGLVFAAMLAGMAIAALGVGILGDRVGRRRLYLGMLCVMGVTIPITPNGGNSSIVRPSLPLTALVFKNSTPGTRSFSSRRRPGCRRVGRWSTG